MGCSLLRLIYDFYIIIYWATEAYFAQLESLAFLHANNRRHQDSSSVHIYPLNCTRSHLHTFLPLNQTLAVSHTSQSFSQSTSPVCEIQRWTVVWSKCEDRLNGILKAGQSNVSTSMRVRTGAYFRWLIAKEHVHFIEVNRNARWLPVMENTSFGSFLPQ